MHHTDFQSLSSDSYEDPYPVSKQLPIGISILKYLPEARQLLEGHNYEKQIMHCKYNQQLSKIPNIMIIKDKDTPFNRPNLNSRLVQLEEAALEHNTMKQKLMGLLKRNESEEKEKKQSLWSNYGGKEPVYARFGKKIQKNNFANNMMAINNVSIDIGFKFRIQRALKIKKDETVLPQSSVKFYSHFQSGNLMYAYRNNSQDIETYDLILQNDINTKGHNQWFFFKLINTKKHNKIRLNIINFTKQQSMFSYGIKPLVFSERQYHNNQVNWHRSGQKVQYFQNHLKRENKNKFYYSLSFQYYFSEPDTVYFAPNYPYTFTQLLNYSDVLMEKHMNNKMICIKPIVETIGGNMMNVITISSGRHEIEKSKVVWIVARQHPGETIGSFMVQGIINFLIQYYKQYYKEEHQPDIKRKYPLDSLIFKIVPMVNIDGVIHGNTRANLTGVDPNRMWKKSIRRLCPEVSALKKMILSHQENIEMILDLHSHSKKLGCFFYGNTVKHNPNRDKVFPGMVFEADKKERFVLKNCRFRGGYQATARNVLFNELNQNVRVYTVECSMLGYMKNNRIIEYTVSDYHEMGQLLIETYLKLFLEQQKKHEERIKRKFQDVIFNDAESARSESSLSDEEYSQIKCKNKKRKINKTKKQTQDKPVLQNLRQGNKPKDQSKVKQSFRGKSAGAFKSPRTNMIRQIFDEPLTVPPKDNSFKQREQPLKKIKHILEQTSNNGTEQKSLPMKIPKLHGNKKVILKMSMKNNENESSSFIRSVKKQAHKSAKEKKKIVVGTEGLSKQKLTVIDEIQKNNIDLSGFNVNQLDSHYTPLRVVGNSLEDCPVEIQDQNQRQSLDSDSHKRSYIQKMLRDDKSQVFNSHPKRLMPLVCKRS